MSQLYLVVIGMDWIVVLFQLKRFQVRRGRSFFFHHACSRLKCWQIVEVTEDKHCIRLRRATRGCSEPCLLSGLGESWIYHWSSGQFFSLADYEKLSLSISPSRLDTNRWRIVYELKQHVRSAVWQMSIVICNCCGPHLLCNCNIHENLNSRSITSNIIKRDSDFTDGAAHLPWTKE